MRTASLVEYLGNRYQLDLVVFREPGAEDPSRAFPAGLVRDVAVIELPGHARHPAARMARNLRRWVRGAPPLNDRFGGFERQLEARLAGRCYQLALVEHFWCAPYWEQVARCSRRVALDLHNIESVYYQRLALAEPPLARALFRRFAKAAQALERRWLPKFSLLVTTSEQDADSVRRLAPDSAVAVYPNALPWVARPEVPPADEIVFSGNLEYPPNQSAVRFFHSRIWPGIRRRFPGLRWRLVGRNARAVRSMLAGDDRIGFSGEVEDAVREIARARVAVVPLLAGSGTRMKILEAWAASVPVVSTALGAEGLPAVHGRHLLVADTPEAFGQAVCGLLESEPWRRMLGEAGRRLYEERFHWKAAWEKLAEAGI